MTKKPKRETQLDPDDVVITDAMWARAKSRDQLPDEIESLLPRRRGPAKKPTKVSITLRLPQQVVAAYKATGEGWQTRIGEELERASKRLPLRKAS